MTTFTHVGNASSTNSHAKQAPWHVDGIFTAGGACGYNLPTRVDGNAGELAETLASVWQPPETTPKIVSGILIILTPRKTASTWRVNRGTHEYMIEHWPTEVQTLMSLEAIRACEGTEVTVAEEVKRSDRAVAARAQHRVPLGCEANGVDRSCVFCERHKAESTLGIEELHLHPSRQASKKTPNLQGQVAAERVFRSMYPTGVPIGYGISAQF